MLELYEHIRSRNAFKRGSQASLALMVALLLALASACGGEKTLTSAVTATGEPGETATAAPAVSATETSLPTQQAPTATPTGTSTLSAGYPPALADVVNEAKEKAARTGAGWIAIWATEEMYIVFVPAYKDTPDSPEVEGFVVSILGQANEGVARQQVEDYFRDKGATDLSTLKIVYRVVPGAIPSPTPTPTLEEDTQETPVAGQTPLAAEVFVPDEIARLQALGFTVDQVITTSLDGSSQHVAMRIKLAQTEGFDPSRWGAVLQFSSPTETGSAPYGRALLLYEVSGSGLVRIFDRLESYISLQPEYGYTTLGALDIDADGIQELAVAFNTGGNCWECSRLVIYTVRNREVAEVAMGLPATGLLGYDENGDGTSAVPGRLEEVDGDGKYEVIAIDTSWELHGFCHACSPSAMFVLAWDGERYVDASSRFPGYYQSRIDGAEGVVATVDTRDISSLRNPDLQACARDEGYMSAAISILLNYGRSGRAQQGWARYLELAQPDRLKTQAWRDALPVLRADLELSVPPDGQPPTGSVPGSALLGKFAICSRFVPY